MNTNEPIEPAGLASTVSRIMEHNREIAGAFRLKSYYMVDRGDVVVNVGDSGLESRIPHFLVLNRTGDNLQALKFKTGKWGRLLPTKEIVTLDADSIVIVIGRPNEFSIHLEEQ